MACLIGLGANLGRPAEQLTDACRLIGSIPQLQIKGISAWHHTHAVGGPADQPPFVNGAVLVQTSLPPTELLARLQEIETQCGRQRHVHWGPRTLDLDILWWHNVRLATPKLTIPHPYFAFRQFAVFPAVEVAPAAIHPATRWNLVRHAQYLRYAPPHFAVHGLDSDRRLAVAQRLADMDLVRPLPHPSADHPADDASGSDPLSLLQWQRAAHSIWQQVAWRQMARPILSPFWLPAVPPSVPPPKAVFELREAVFELREARADQVSFANRDAPFPFWPIEWRTVEQAAADIAAALHAIQGTLACRSGW